GPRQFQFADEPDEPIAAESIQSAASSKGAARGQSAAGAIPRSAAIRFSANDWVRGDNQQYDDAADGQVARALARWPNQRVNGGADGCPPGNSADGRGPDVGGGPGEIGAWGDGGP